jgi:hypothetical protein
MRANGENMTDKSKIDFATINVPKNVRLNMAQRKEISTHLAQVAHSKAKKDRDLKAWNAELTEKMHSALWRESKFLEEAKKMPKNFFPNTESVRASVLELESRQVGLTENDTISFVRTSLHTRFSFVDADEKILKLMTPYFSDYYGITVFEKRTPEIDKYMKSNCPNIDLGDDDLVKEIYDFLTFEVRLNKAHQKLKEQAFETLKQIKSVKELQRQWPAAFEAYYHLFSAYITDNKNALVPSSSVVDITKMIEDFPDMAAE